jgi:hypothetical protein
LNCVGGVRLWAREFPLGLDLMKAIITAATGYSEADLQPFLCSVDRACPDSKVFLIAYKRHLARVEKLRRRFPFIEPVYIRYKFNTGGSVYRWLARHFIDDEYPACDPFWRRLGRYSLDIMLDRFFLALEVVQNHRTALTHVLLADSRDVIFQRDPFEQIGPTLVSGLEEKIIGDCPRNSDWIMQVYGAEVHRRLSKRTVVCAGISLGPVKEVEQYLVLMCGEIWRCLPKVAAIEQYDQAIHNYLIYNGGVNLELTDNRAGIIATLHYESSSNIQIDDVMGVAKVQGTAPAIIHQYDRHDNLLRFVKERFQVENR